MDPELRDVCFPLGHSFCSLMKLIGGFEEGHRDWIRTRVCRRNLPCFLGGRPHLKCQKENIGS